MTRSRTLLGAVLSVVAAGAVVLGTSISASANSAYLVNDAKSAKGIGQISAYGTGNWISYSVDVWDIKADGYCARGQLILTNSNGSEAGRSDVVTVCGNGTSDGIVVTGLPRNLINGAIFKVWNGTGVAVQQTLNLAGA